jgi:glutathione S-transferase
MRLFDGGRVPNARRTRIFLAEKGISIPLVPVDLAAFEHRGAAFTAMNAMQRVPVLELDDGSYLSESIAICRYFEEVQPEPPLFGTGARERATIEMWNRRIELDFYLAIQAVFRHTHPGMAKSEGHQVPEWGEINRPRVMAMLAMMDRELADRPFVAGERLSVADITRQVAVDFLKPIRIAVPEDHAHLRRWHGEMSARPSALA